VRYWWVNQNQTYRHEVPGDYLWSPKRKANGDRNPFYDFMREVAPGDAVFSFAETQIRAIGIVVSHAYEAPKPLEFGQTGAYWDNIGWRVDIRFVELRLPIRPSEHMNVLAPLLPERYSPLLRTGMGYPSRESEREIMQQHTGGRDAASEVSAVMEAGDVEMMQRAVELVRVDDSLRDYAIDIVERTRHAEQLTLGVSPRGLLMLQRAAQARAFLEGREYCTPDDFKQLILPVFAHRVVVNTRYASTQKKAAQVETILREIIEATRVPL